MKLSPNKQAVVSLKGKVIIDLASHYKNSLSDKISLFKSAISQSRLVSFDYYSDKGISKRLVEPYFITFKWSSWYIYGFCTSKKEFRLFKQNRLWNQLLSEEHFKPQDIPKDDCNKDFVKRVNELGFMSLSNILPGFPSLSEETPKELWHTGNYYTDPWCWKDRAAEEKQLAFGCILGGHKGFVSAEMYPYFYTLFQPQMSMEESWQEGIVSPAVWDLWRLFEEKTFLDTSDIRQEMGVTMKKGGSKVDNAIIELQKHYYITVAGSRRKLNKLSEPYGWAVNVYDKVDNWAPDAWIKNCNEINPDAARQKIIETGITISENVGEKDLMKFLVIKVHSNNRVI
ncbi:MAG: WYL domain-containing protein [Ruminiclostridium sp.]